MKAKDFTLEQVTQALGLINMAEPPMIKENKVQGHFSVTQPVIKVGYMRPSADGGTTAPATYEINNLHGYSKVNTPELWAKRVLAHLHSMGAVTVTSIGKAGSQLNGKRVNSAAEEYAVIK